MVILPGCLGNLYSFSHDIIIVIVIILMIPISHKMIDIIMFMDTIQIFAFITSHSVISIISSFFLFFYLMKIRTGIIAIIFITLRILSYND